MTQAPIDAVRITGVGAEIPVDVITTAEIEERAALHQRFHLEPGWLEHVTGVRTRRWAPAHVQPSELAMAAGTKALRSAGVDPLDVDTLIFAGITRDCLEPATANLVAEAVGTRNVVYVPVEGGDGRFAERTVKLGAALGDSFEVLDGVKPGELVVTTGSFFLRAEAGRPRSGG